MAKRNDLGNDKLWPLVLRLAIPSMLAQFVNVLYSIVDRIYIGNIPQVGEIALAGAGICGPLITFISSFASLVGLGGAPLLAIRMGEQDQEGAEKILSNCFIMLVVLAILLSVSFLLFRRPLLMLFGASQQTLPYALDYMTIYSIGTIFAILSLGLNYFITAQGFPTMGMATIVIGAVVNIILDPVFIFGLDMGIAGAAIATVIAQMTSCFFVLFFLFSQKPPVRIRFKGYDTHIMKRVVTFGATPFIILATDSVLILVLNAMLQRYGGPQEGDMLVTCCTIVQSFMLLITMPMSGITGGTQAILSYNYGAKKTDRIRQGEKYILLLAVLFAVIMFVLTRTVPHYFVSIFTKNPEYMELSVWGIQTFTLAIIPMAFQYTLVDGLTALGIARYAVTLSLLRKLTFLACTVILPMVFFASAAFYAEPIADFFCSIITTVVFLLTFNKLMKKREEMPEGQQLYS